MSWNRVILSWMTLLAVVFASATAAAAADVSPKTHVGAIDLTAAICIEAQGLASAEEHLGNPRLSTADTSDVPHAARAAHIFRPAVGHVNPASAGSQQRFIELFQRVATNPANLRTDAVSAGIITQHAAAAGVRAYTWIANSGRQVWVTVRGNEILNAGVNAAGAIK